MPTRLKVPAEYVANFGHHMGRLLYEAHRQSVGVQWTPEQTVFFMRCFCAPLPPDLFVEFMAVLKRTGALRAFDDATANIVSRTKQGQFRFDAEKARRGQEFLGEFGNSVLALLRIKPRTRDEILAEVKGLNKYQLAYLIHALFDLQKISVDRLHRRGKDPLQLYHYVEKNDSPLVDSQPRPETFVEYMPVPNDKGLVTWAFEQRAKQGASITFDQLNRRALKVFGQTVDWPSILKDGQQSSSQKFAGRPTVRLSFKLID